MEETAKQHYIIGDNLRHKGFYDDAVEEFEKSLNIRQSLLDEYDVELAKTHYALGLSQKALKNYPPAFYHLQKCLDTFEYLRDVKKVGLTVVNEEEEETERDDDEDDTSGEKKDERPVASQSSSPATPSLNVSQWIMNIKLNLARTHHCQGLDYQLNSEFDKSISEHQKALGIRELYLGSNHLETARTYYVLGCALSDHGLYDQALSELRRALRIRHLVFGNSHLDTLEVVDNMLVVLQAKGTYTHGVISDYKEAILKSIQLEQNGDIEIAKCKGKHHSSTNNIAEYAEEAMVHYRKSLSLEEQCLGELGPTTCDLHLKVAKTLGILNYLDESLDEYKNSIHVYERLLGKFHYKMGQVYCDLADVLLERDEYETSLCFYTKAYGILDATVGQHDDTKKALDKVRMAATLLAEHGSNIDGDDDEVGVDDGEEAKAEAEGEGGEKKEEEDGGDTKKEEEKTKDDNGNQEKKEEEDKKDKESKDVVMEDATKDTKEEKKETKKEEDDKDTKKDPEEDDEFKDAVQAPGGYDVDWD